MPSGNSSNQSCDRSDAPIAEVVRGRTHERYSTESCGSWEHGRSGANCPASTRRSSLATLPARVIGDKAYDSDRLDRDLAERYGIEMIAPHRGERRTPTQDGRPLRRYRRRWRVVRLFAWLHHFRRLVIRWEYHVENFFGMVRLGCMQILFRYL